MVRRFTGTRGMPRTKGVKAHTRLARKAAADRRRDLPYAPTHQVHASYEDRIHMHAYRKPSPERRKRSAESLEWRMGERRKRGIGKPWPTYRLPLKKYVSGPSHGPWGLNISGVRKIKVGDRTRTFTPQEHSYDRSNLEAKRGAYEAKGYYTRIFRHRSGKSGGHLYVIYTARKRGGH